MLKGDENPTPLGVVTGTRRTARMKPEAWRFEECIDAEWAGMPDAKRLWHYLRQEPSVIPICWPGEDIKVESTRSVFVFCLRPDKS